MYLNNSKPLSVLFISTSFPRFLNDFAGSFVYRFAKYLAEENCNIHVIAPGEKPYPDFQHLEKIKVYRFSYFYPEIWQSVAYRRGGIYVNLKSSIFSLFQLPFFLLSMTLKVRKLYPKVDIIHCHWLPTIWPALIVRFFSRQKKPIVFTNWGSDTRKTPDWIIKLTLKNIQSFISTAEETDQHLYRVGIKNINRIMAPIDEEKFIKPKNNLLRQELKIEDNVPVISFIGRLHEFKDPITFINACLILKNNQCNFIALIAGDGVLRNECERIIKQNSLHNEVRLLGSRTDTEKIFDESILTVHISPIENTWANSIAEAMFMGCPVIMSDAGYTKKTFTDGKDCLIVPKEHAKTLANKIKLLLMDKVLQNEISTGAYELLKRKKKNKELITEQLITLYKQEVSGYTKESR